MKKVLPAAIILAAVAGSYFLLKSKISSVSLSTNEKLIGTWKLDSIASHSNDSLAQMMPLLLMGIDSSAKSYLYEFTQDGLILKKQGSSKLVDSERYQLKEPDLLIWFDKFTDSTGEKLSVTWLSDQQLQLATGDSTLLFFKKQP